MNKYKMIMNDETILKKSLYQTLNYKLREFDIEDIDSITKYANNKNIAKWLSNEFPHPYLKQDAEKFINMVSKEDPTSTFAIEINKEVVGAITVFPQKNNEPHTMDTPISICSKQAELGYWLAEKYWNKGIMTSTIKKMVKYGFKTFDIECIFATPFKSNIISQKVLEKAGFRTDSKARKIIKNNENYEVIILSLIKNQYRL